ncbi:filament-like plant protein 7 isoform X2 [Salvia miltiorrhiza]|uniref:filament-like plant protein 7 isoform X2 n=1 Tax=Salvia miltiorrhiza TaxID=226208 RepID=UPI0025ACDDDE|nr:filament-like plant protein 7 isoform X2 [Salvia miltiorrhiza]XP_057806677.1 filament-like plant protein 7 isoform X2 [Salvia miltiorrhiza]
MDQKSWLWKKKSTEKTLVADKASNSLSKNEEEVTELQKLTIEKTGLEKDIQILNERLSSTLSDCIAKDNIAKKQVKIAEEAIAGWEKEKTEAIALKQELDKVLQQKASSEERVDHLDAALKECMHQLRFVREEQERRVHGALTKTSEEFEKIQSGLREQLVEACKKHAKLDAENARLSNTLSGKDKVIEDLGKYRSQLEADFNALLLRSECTEKENASLKYEVHVLEKELDIRSEEREFNRRIADVAQRHQQESAVKIAKLETECQRLRLLVQTRLPGPATLAKMRCEVKSLAKDHADMNRRKSNLSPTTAEFSTELIPDMSNERINLLTEQLYTMVEENRALKEALKKKSSELQLSRKTYAPTSSKFPRAAGLFEESLIKCQVPTEPGKDSFLLQQNTLAASSDVGSDDKASCAESFSSALILELEHLKNEKRLRTPAHSHMATLDMNLMDDFAEMEKLAVLSLDDPAGSPNSSSEHSNAVLGSPGSPSGANSSSEPIRGCALICGSPSEHVIPSQEIHSGCVAGNGIPEKLGDLLKMLLEHSHSSKRNPQDILEDIKFALAHCSVESTVFCSNGSAHHAEASNSGSGHVEQANKSSNVRNGNNITIFGKEKSGQKFGPNVSIPIRKVLELLEGINIQSQDNGIDKNSGNPTGYTVRVLQWKTAELSAILRQFVQTCNDFLIGTANLEQFALQIASSLEWIMSRCFSLQDVSSMKHAIRNNLDWDDSGSESEEESEPVSHMHNSTSKMEAFQPPLKEEVKIWNVEWPSKESAVATGSEGCLHSETCMRECFIQPQESENGNGNLHSKIEGKEQSEGIFENQLEKQKMIKEDLETQLMESNRERVKACERISFMENELENKNNCYKRLEETCHELQIQLKSVTSKEVPDNGKHQEKQLSDDWEITAASEKLAECQETILNLGKQLKALASPCDAALFDKVISAPADSPVFVKNISRRSSLLDKMLAEDSDTRGASPDTKTENHKGNINSGVSSNDVTESSAQSVNPNGMMNHEQKAKSVVASTDIVPRKKHGGTSFFKRLFWRRKKGKNDKTTFS